MAREFFLSPSKESDKPAEYEIIKLKNGISIKYIEETSTLGGTELQFIFMFALTFVSNIITEVLADLIKDWLEERRKKEARINDKIKNIKIVHASPKKIIINITFK